MSGNSGCGLRLRLYVGTEVICDAPFLGREVHPNADLDDMLGEFRAQHGDSSVRTPSTEDDLRRADEAARRSHEAARRRLMEQGADADDIPPDDLDEEVPEQGIDVRIAIESPDGQCVAEDTIPQRLGGHDELCAAAKRFAESGKAAD